MKYHESITNGSMIKEIFSQHGPTASVHKAEWERVLAGEPVQINPSVGSGEKVMTIKEYASRWKANHDHPLLTACISCKGINTKEHHFMQTWCRSCVQWEAEILCLDCHGFSHRSFKDPNFKTPAQHEKETWENMARG